MTKFQKQYKKKTDKLCKCCQDVENFIKKDMSKTYNVPINDLNDVFINKEEKIEDKSKNETKI